MRRETRKTGGFPQRGGKKNTPPGPAAAVGPKRPGWLPGLRNGHAQGFHIGYMDGYRLGRCTQITERIGHPLFPVYAKKVMYVRIGIDVPYPPLDEAVIGALGGLVGELRAASPGENLAQIAAAFRPDLMLTMHGFAFPLEQLAEIRGQGIATAIWFTDDPYYSEWSSSVAPQFDYVFTLETSCVPFYRNLGCTQVYELPFAVNPCVFYPKRADLSQRSEICFIGSAFRNRSEMIDRIAPFLSKRKTFISGLWWDRLKQYPLLSGKIRLGQWMDPETTAEYYNGADIVINLHRAGDDPELNRNSLGLPALSINPRTFEINGCAAFQLSDVRAELNRFYVPGSEIETYASPEELMEKLDYYLRHEEERREIALRGYERTIREHTYAHRLYRLLETVFGPVNQP